MIQWEPGIITRTIKLHSLPTAMHLGATAALLFRHHDNETLKDILRRLDKDKLVGTLSYSDPATGELMTSHEIA